MERPEHQMAGFRRSEGEPDRLQVAHFAYEHDVGILAQRRAQRFGETERVSVHLPLVDETTLGLVHELDWILDRDDVVRAIVVAMIDHARECGRLARAR